MSNILTTLQASLDSFLAWFSTTVKQTTAAYCDLETADDRHTFVTHDGSLVSLIRVHGTRQLIEEESFKALHQHITHSFGKAMAQPGHTIQVIFHHDPDAIIDDLKTALAPSLKTQQQLHLSLSDVFEERVEQLAQYCRYESVYIVLFTNTKHLNTSEAKKAEQDKLQLIRDKQLSPFTLTQNIIAAIPLLRHKHDMFVRSMLEALEIAEVHVRLLEVHEAAWQIRKLADPEFTSSQWRASLPGDKVPLKRYTARAQDNLCDILWPSLARQLLPRDAENINLRVTRWGDRIYSCLFVDLLPKDIQPFKILLQQKITADIPWRISLLSESDQLYQLKFKAMLASILSFSSDENRLLSNANNLLNYINVNSDEAIVQLKIVVCTWALEDQEDLLRIRIAALARAMQHWGMSDLSEISGDTFEGVVSTLPGVSAHSIATPTLLPCSAMTYLLPLERPASPWKTGSQLFRTPDGKLWPFEPGSRLQTTWIDLIYARPGAGKSVLSNALNLSVCLKAGLMHLPYLSIVDIGPSSKGLIALLKEALPSDQQYQVAYRALKMDSHHTINPFDTQLGARYPTYQERSFLINFLTLLATPVEEHAAYDGIADMAGLVIDELYKQYADHAKPALYTQQIEPSIDQLLSTFSINVDNRTTWWEITDNLFQQGEYIAARRAQRHAMPLLAEVVHIIQTGTVSDLYGKMTTRTGELLIDAFGRMISSAIREYPILSGPTQFDSGEARVVAFDLEAVTKSGGPAADRQTAVMYMLARYLSTRHYALNPTLLDTVPTLYRSYHQNRLQEIASSTKRIVFDEFHRTGKSTLVREQIINDMREGRKWNVQIALISQSLTDFDPVMIELATSTYILDAGPLHTIEQSGAIFGFSKAAQQVLKEKVRGPQKAGTTFLGRFVTTEGTYTPLLTLTLGPIELWALNTSVEDVVLREKLYSALAPAKARSLLAKRFNEGTARGVIEKRLLTNTTDLTTQTTHIIEQIYCEIIEAAKTQGYM